MKEFETDKKWTCMGGVMLYNTELHRLLKEYSPIEQWNLCCQTSGGEYREKYGVRYRTFSSNYDGFSLHKDAFEDEV